MLIDIRIDKKHILLYKYYLDEEMKEKTLFVPVLLYVHTDRLK